MTLPSEENTVSYIGDGATVNFPFPYKYIQKAHIIVKVDGVTQVLDTDYSLTTAGSESGGTVTFVTAPALLDSVILQRVVTYKQETDFENFDGNPAEVTEGAFDYLTMQTQQIAEVQERSIVIPIGTTIASNEISGTIDATTRLITVTDDGFQAVEISTLDLSSGGDVILTSPMDGDFLVLSGSDIVNTAAPSGNYTFSGEQLFSGNVTFEGTSAHKGKFQYQDDGERTISSGAITMLGSYHTIDTQADAASDDLDTISTTGSGLFCLWRAENDSRTVVVKHNTGNIYIATALDISLDTTNRVIGTLYDSELSKHFVLFDGTTKEYVTSQVTTAKVYSGTAVASTSGSSISFTSLPSGIKKLTLNLVGVSTNGTANLITQIGDAGGLETTGYLGATGFISVTTPQSTNYTNGVNLPAAAASTFHGQIVWELVDASTFTWTASINVSTSDAARSYFGGYSKSLTAELDRIAITTTDTFDAGKINIQYEL